MHQLQYMETVKLSLSGLKASTGGVGCLCISNLYWRCKYIYDRTYGTQLRTYHFRTIYCTTIPHRKHSGSMANESYELVRFALQESSWLRYTENYPHIFSNPKLDEIHLIFRREVSQTLKTVESDQSFCCLPAINGLAIHSVKQPLPRVKSMAGKRPFPFGAFGLFSGANCWFL